MGVEVDVGVGVGVGAEVEITELPLVLVLVLVLPLLLPLPLLALLAMLVMLVALDVAVVVLWAELFPKELEDEVLSEVVVASDVESIGVPITLVPVAAGAPAPVDPPAVVVTSAAAPVGTMGMPSCATQ